MGVLDFFAPKTPQLNVTGRVDPSKLPAGFLDAYRGMDSDGARPYALIGGGQLGLDNNYQYAVYPDGRIEPAYQGFDPTYDPNMSATPDPGMRYRTLSELLAQGGQKGGVDSHGMPLIQGDVGGYRYAPQPDIKNGPGGLGDAIGLGAFTLMTMGLGSAAAGGAGAGMAGAGAGEAGAGAGAAGAFGDAGVYGLSGIESASAPGLTYGGTAGAGGTAAGAGAGAAAGAGPGEWADLSSWLGADATGAPAYDATEAALNSSMIAGAGGSTSGAIGGASAGAGTAGAAAAGGGSALSRLTGGNADMINLAGTLGAAGLGAYGANEYSNRLKEIYDDMASKREPYRQQSLAWLNDPSSYVNGPGAASLDATLRRLSVGGNPISDPTKLGIATQAGLQNWQNAVTGMGNLGLSGEDARANVASNAAGAANDVYTNLGAGLGALTRPKRTLADYIGGLV